MPGKAAGKSCRLSECEGRQLLARSRSGRTAPGTSRVRVTPDASVARSEPPSLISAGRSKAWDAENPELADQRPGRARLTRRNVGDSHTPGNPTAETGLRGWACRNRTCKCHFGKCPLKC